jgi:hypothetical protein
MDLGGALAGKKMLRERMREILSSEETVNDWRLLAWAHAKPGSVWCVGEDWKVLGWPRAWTLKRWSRSESLPHFKTIDGEPEDAPAGTGTRFRLVPVEPMRTEIQSASSLSGSRRLRNLRRRGADPHDIAREGLVVGTEPHRGLSEKVRVRTRGSLVLAGRSPARSEEPEPGKIGT